MNGIILSGAHPACLGYSGCVGNLVARIAEQESSKNGCDADYCNVSIRAGRYALHQGVPRVKITI